MGVDEKVIDLFWELIGKTVYEGEEKKEVIYVSFDEDERSQISDLGKREIGDYLTYWLECWGTDEDFIILKHQFQSIDFEEMTVSLTDGAILYFEIDEDPFEE
ncbi:hypothetical protein JFT58_22785 [Pseudomonas sp. MF6767]|uniref:hypothetical protein n=1 Tax=Pseudomonas sp. MF6767 TaxID=2797531 RepID=UPI0018E8518F|nr:hypothetical protein [Pseudomonas sp. MF6767]MBJ2281115.1 hypothetical protein [Pseudomonas sp. MF6767]